MENFIYIVEFMKMVEDRLTKLHDDNSKIEFLTERLEWLDGYQKSLEDILESEYLKPENIWRRSISPEDETSDPYFNEYDPNMLYASGYEEVVNKLVSEYNKDRQLDFLKKLKDDVIAPIYLCQTPKWTDIEKGVQNRLNEVQLLQKKTDRLKHAIEKQVELKKNKAPKVVGMKTRKVEQVEVEKQPNKELTDKQYKLISKIKKEGAKILERSPHKTKSNIALNLLGNNQFKNLSFETLRKYYSTTYSHRGKIIK